MRVGTHPDERVRPMVKVIDDRFMACSACAQVIVNGDYSPLDYYYSDPKECQAVIERINEGMENAGGNIMRGDEEQDDGFSTERCDCCGTRLAGARTHCVVLGN